MPEIVAKRVSADLPKPDASKAVESAYGSTTNSSADENPALYTPLKIRGMTVNNRLCVPPMCMYSCSEDGEMSDFHFAQYASYIMGGAGLVIIEAAAIHPDGRLSNKCIGLYNEKSSLKLKRLVELAHNTNSGCKIGIQINHGGRIAGTVPASMVRTPLPNWNRIAPSAIAYEGIPEPKAMTSADMELVKKGFADAAKKMADIGMDCVEIHSAHGYLLHQFLSPLTNQRTDGYGGPNFEDRIKFPLEVIRAVRAAFPEDRPVTIRFSASDLAPKPEMKSWTPDECLKFCQLLEEEKLIEVFSISCAGLIKEQDLSALCFTDPGYQVKYAEYIKKGLKKPTSYVMAAGNISTSEFANSIVAEGKSDFICVGREALRNPRFGLNWGVELEVAVKPDQQLAPGYMMSKMKLEMIKKMKEEQSKSN